MPKAIRNSGEIQNQRVITTDLDDTPANGNALFPRKLTGGIYANAILVGLDGTNNGAVKIRYLDGSDETIPFLAAGVWISMRPFSHVWLTGTTADTVMVGHTFQ